MSDYRQVHSSLAISQHIAGFMDMAGIIQNCYAVAVSCINDVLQGRASQTVDELFAELKEKCGAAYAPEIEFLQDEVEAFLQQKSLLAEPYTKLPSANLPYHYDEIYPGEKLKIIDQALYDRAAADGFPKDFFRRTYFNQVTFYCLPDRANLTHSIFNDCDFTVCRLKGANFQESRLYGGNFHDCNIEDGSFCGATIANINFQDCQFANVSFSYAYISKCNTIDCSLEEINFYNTVLNSSAYSRVCAKNIRRLYTANITAGGATEQEVKWLRQSIFRTLTPESPTAPLNHLKNKGALAI